MINGYYEVDREIKYFHFNNKGKDWKLSSYPYLDIVLGDGCNAGCSFCVACLKHKSANLKIDSNFKEKLNFAINKMGVREVLLLGGEPTIYNSFFEAMKILNGKHDLRKICTTTNGQRLKDKTYLKKFMASGITNVNISLMSIYRDEQMKYNGGKFFITPTDLARIGIEARKNRVHLRIQANCWKGINDTPKKILEYYDSVARYADSVKVSPLLQTDAFSTKPEISDWNRKHILTPNQYDELFTGALDGFGTPYTINPRTLGFVKYGLVNKDGVPLICNFNHRGKLMDLVVKESKIHGAKILPTGELSLSWNRELSEYFIDTRSRVRN